MVTVIMVIGVVIRHTLDRSSGVFSSLGQHEQPPAPQGTETVGGCGILVNCHGPSRHGGPWLTTRRC